MAWGKSVTLPARPERVVAYMRVGCRALGLRRKWPELYLAGVTRPDGTPEVYVGDLDLESVVNLGETYGELDLEGLDSARSRSVRERHVG